MNIIDSAPKLKPDNSESRADQNAVRDCLLARLRVAAAELAVMRNDLALICSGLKHRLLTPHQAMQMAYDRDVLDWLFQDKEGSA